jgi:phosphohistidine phosphatase
MDLILWRHADAEEGRDDLARRLTTKGEKQAKRMAEWLDERLSKEASVIVSPAVRAQQTAKPLGRESETSEAVAPGASAEAILKAARWPHASGMVVIVGHQPSLGAAAALAITGKRVAWPIKKGGLWWIRTGEGSDSPVVLAVMSPSFV